MTGAEKLYAELRRQAEGDNPFDSPYVGAWEPGALVGIDGPVDLDALAAALDTPDPDPDPFVTGKPWGPALEWSEYLHKDWMLNMNQRLYFLAKNERTQLVKTLGRVRSRKLGRYDRVKLDIAISYPARFSADVHNYMPTAKAYVDGLVDVPDTVKGQKKLPARGILTDDSDAYMAGPFLHFKPGGSARADHFRLDCVLQPLWT